MVSGQTFILDANVFIEAARRYYAFDLVPQYWSSLVRLSKGGSVYSIDRVRTELVRGKDELAKWADHGFSDAFLSTDTQEITESYRKIIAWVNKQAHFTEPAKADFASGADGWLIACAMVKGAVVVTHEEFARDAKNKVKIPNVCQAFGLHYVNTFEMLRLLHIQL